MIGQLAPRVTWDIWHLVADYFYLHFGWLRVAVCVATVVPLERVREVRVCTVPGGRTYKTD